MLAGIVRSKRLFEDITTPDPDTSGSSATHELINYLRESTYSCNEAALKQVREFLNSPNRWILNTPQLEAVIELFGDCSDLIDLEYESRCALDVLKKIELDFFKQLVVWGHLNQGKSQFMYFLSGLLQNMQEIVVYIDGSFSVAADEDLTANCLPTCTKWWDTMSAMIPQLELGDRVHRSYNLFYDTVSGKIPFPKTSSVTRCTLLELFLENLEIYAEAAGLRLWLIVDDVATGKNWLKYFLPSDKRQKYFHSIVTGRENMGRFIHGKRLKDWTYNLPYFTKTQYLRLIGNLNSKLVRRGMISLHEAVEDATNGDDAGEWLMKTFDGIPGYLIELCDRTAKGISHEMYMEELKSRVYKLLDLRKRLNKRLSTCYGFFSFELQAVGICNACYPRGAIQKFVIQYSNEPCHNSRN